jgi:hypothetical protein
MRQAAVWLSLLLLLALGACSSVPTRKLASHESGGAAHRAPSGAFRTPPGLPEFIDHSVGEEEISIQAMSLVGVPYRWGGNTPASGFDCSGLVRYVVGRAAEVELPRTTADMSSAGSVVEPSGVAPGDLIFFNTTGRAHSHVGIYVGKMRFVNAPSTGGTVRIDYLTNPYWAKHFDGIRRVASRHVKPTPFDAPTVVAASPAPVPVRGSAESYESLSAHSAFGASDARELSPMRSAADPHGTALHAPAEVRDQQPRPAATRPASALAAASRAPALDPDGAPARASDRAPDPYEPPPPNGAGALAQARAALGVTDAPMQGEGSARRPDPITMNAIAVPAERAPTGSAATANNSAADPIAQFAHGAL